MPAKNINWHEELAARSLSGVNSTHGRGSEERGARRVKPGRSDLVMWAVARRYVTGIWPLVVLGKRGESAAVPVHWPKLKAEIVLYVVVV